MLTQEEIDNWDDDANHIKQLQEELLKAWAEVDEVTLELRDAEIRIKELEERLKKVFSLVDDLAEHSIWFQRNVARERPYE
jgi:archaellum component FlaC